MINMQRLNNPANPLLTFGKALGISSDDWMKREELQQITYTDYYFSQEKAKELTLDLINSLRMAYGDALTCCFRLDDLPVLDIDSNTNEQSLTEFIISIEDSPTIIFTFTLNKMKLVENWLGDIAGYHIFLYLFPNALENFLASNLNQLECLLWGSELNRINKVILLVPDREIWLDGSYLAVLGGEQIGHLTELISKPSQGADELQDMYNICLKNLNWQVPWLKHLTPLHLKVQKQIPCDDLITKELLIHQVNCIILYTADRTVGDENKPLVSTYVSANQSVELTLMDPVDVIEENILSGVSSLMEMLEWTYNSTWSTDRIPLVQIGISQALRASSPLDYYKLLLYNAPNIFDGLKWHWKAFVEGKVDNYVSQTKELDDYIANTVQAFANQITDLIKNLSDTMLAAVGVLIGSFIAALFKDEFNSNIFAIGIIVYALYVFIFPLLYNMKHQWEQYQILCDNFDKRKRRFEDRLYPKKVSEIVGEQIIDSQNRFEWWFKATLIAYMVIILLAIIAVLFVKDYIPHIIDYSYS